MVRNTAASASALRVAQLLHLHQLVQGFNPLGASCACAQRQQNSSTLEVGSGDEVDGGLRELLLRVELVAGKKNPERCIREVVQSSFDADDAPDVKVVMSGYHKIECGFTVVGGNALVEASGSCILLVVGAPKVRARGDVVVYATNSATLFLYDNVYADLSGDVTMRSYDSVRGVARDRVTGMARGKSRWTVSGNAHLDTYDQAMSEGYEGAEIRAYGRSRLCGRDTVKAHLFDFTNGWFTDQAEVSAAGNAIIYPDRCVNVKHVGGAARVIPLPANQRLQLF